MGNQLSAISYQLLKQFSNLAISVN